MIIYMKPHSRNGHLFTMQDFIDSCRCRALINYDGFGYYATEDLQTDIKVLPSDVSTGKIDKSWPYVIWFNR